MTDQPGKLSPFGITAVALDQDLQRFQQLTEAAKRVPLNSRKNIERAAKMSAEAAQAHIRLGEHMGTLVAALQEARARNEACVQDLTECKERITRRMGEVGALVDRVNALGQVATEISGAVAKLGAAAPEEGASPDTIAALAALGTRMDGIIEEARTLSQSARDADLAELADEIESLRQQVHAARNKMKLLGEKMRLLPPPK